ncbi:MAG: TetR/AcrR family transcriptional regulator [Humibacillus sp.]|nr:TetR/AcrR family transcriptional regulator [Humibacillus sp.]MDN5779536.1 TetR/AcrR family transcriptional regulator [Humibacillus sp.]
MAADMADPGEPDSAADCGSVDAHRHTDLLDAAVSYLVAHPRASLGQIAAAAGMGRTSLFKRFPTRDALEHAVAVRALTVCHAAITGARDDTASDGGLRSLVAALVPIGPQLNFIWRTPALDVDAEVVRQYRAMDAALYAALERARGAGALRDDRPGWWLSQTLYALVYVAWESVRDGTLARRDAPDLVLDTLVGGLGRRPAPEPVGLS